MAARSKTERGRITLHARRVAKLNRATYNPRRIGEANKAALGSSLDEFGLVQPIVVNRRSVAKGWPKGEPETVVGGHQRLDLLEGEGTAMTDVVLVDLDEPREKALNIALNSGRLAGEFTDGLGALLADIKGALPTLHAALQMPGMKANARDLDASAGANLADLKDPQLERAAKASARLGDLYELGEHRLLCGDATDPAVVAHVMGGALADCVYTDPPYGVAYEAEGFEPIAGDELTRDDLVALLQGSLSLAVRHATDAAAFYVWHASSTREDFAFAMKAVGLEERQYLIWATPQLVLGRADYQWAHEPCFYAGKAGHRPKWHGDRAQPTIWRVEARTRDGAAVVLGPGLIVSDGDGHEVTLLARAPKRKLRGLRVPPGETALVFADENAGTLWEVSRDPGKAIHPTQKPVALAARAIANSTEKGGHVLDVFHGGGAMVLACEQLGRIGHAVELYPPYVDEAVARWEKLTGRKATRRRPKKGAKR